jgi:hypothetical protein
MTLAERTWTFAERRPKALGPWGDEPDKVQWIDEATGLDCLAVRNHMGAWCGYVGLPPGHALYGAGYDEAHDRMPGLAVHGGLTYAGRCQTDDPDMGICHVPAPGRPDDVWCGHAFDLIPRFLEPPLGPLLSRHTLPDEVYRDLEYVRTEVTSLAAQLARTESPLGAER